MAGLKLVIDPARPRSEGAFIKGMYNIYNDVKSILEGIDYKVGI